jgi:hypothetical protein
VRAACAEAAARRRKDLTKLFAARRIDSVPIHTDEDYIPALKTFFDRRERRLAA